MNIREKKNIKVYNECPSRVNLIGQRREYIFPPCTNDDPPMSFVDFDEIEYANSRGQLFALGLLVFDESEREEIYDALGIKNWRETVWFKKDIEDCILNPTLEKMQRVIDIKNISAFERVRGAMVRFMNEGRDVSQNVINIVNSRYREICSGITTSKIVIRQADVDRTEQAASSQEVDDLKRQIEEMKKLMAQMTAAMAQAAPAQTQEESAQAEDGEPKPKKTTTSRKTRKASAKE